MDFLKAQIDSKKRALEAAAPSSELPPSAKYIKTTELERIRTREREFLANNSSNKRSQSPASGVATPAPTKPARDESPATLLSQAAATLRSEQQQQLSSASSTEQPEKFNVSNEDAIRRLRQKGQPIRLFGETDKDRRLRLRALELIEERTEGQRNDFMRAMDAVGAGMTLEEVAKQSQTSATTTTTTTTTQGSDGKGEVNDSKTDSKASEERAKAISSARKDSDSVEPNPKDEEVVVDLSLIKKNPHKVYPQIYHALKRVLKEWEQSLAERPEAVRRSTQGKIAAATQQTSAEYLKPLFKQLRKRELTADVLQNVAEITHFMQRREYLRANDAYLRLSIGNAPWPIGVTMVGIHARAGRERVSQSHIAHALNDETTRKWIQTLKRLLSFAQSKRPPSDLSQLMG
ncbi:hypothetical protein OIO90_002497 [Microbotryomycetes sp. JL221]|nr:hypothetical protein OIO90_002497 [Microbotryomycetes sp. JL221]